MSQKTTTILITGFGPFPGALDNPSGHLATSFVAQQSPNIGGSPKIVSGVLPTDWQKVEPALLDLLVRHQPDFAVHFGYAASSPGFQLETTAYNQTCSEPDVEGMIVDCGPVSTKGPAQLDCSHPLGQLSQILNASGINASCSHDPGRYLCNMAYYLSLAYSAGRACTSLFIHIPALVVAGELLPKQHPVDQALPLDRAHQGIELVIESCLAGKSNS